MYKKLMAYIKEYKLASLLAPIFVSLEVVMEVLIPMMMAQIIDVGLANNNIPYVYKIGIIMIGMALISLLFGALSGRYAAVASAGVAKNLRQAIYYKIQDFSFANIDKFSTSSLVTRLTTDVTNVQNAYQVIIRMMVRAPIMLIFALFMAFQLNAQLSVIFLFVIPFLGVALYFIMTRAHPNFVKMFKKYDLVNLVVQENLTSIRTVKAYVREDYENKKFKEATGELQQYSINAEKILAFNSPIMQLSMYFTIIMISWFGAQFIIGGSMETGQLMSLFTYVTQILSSLMMISMSFVMVTMAKSSAERIIEVLDEESDLTNASDPLTQVKDGSIEFRNVDFSYSKDPNNLALSQINIKIKSGQTVGILGGTGSAKTSLVQMIPRLYDVTNGQILVGGQDVRNIDIETLRDNVAMVLQKNILFSGTIKENLRWGDANATDEDIIHACQLAQADEFIQSFPEKYDTLLDQGGTNVSGGQKQRLCIARALLKKPKILILDDSTSAVDTKTDALIRKAFKEEIPNTTKIIIAQRVSSVEDADMIIVLDDGKINGIGTHEELLKTNAIYQEVYESQTKGDDQE
ncbi:ABC transporter ATP-binding protein [Beduini massiliensis]|uniref:ABC transporter ATP-binding protein n=1 Tax=Beduini massiliensis TaxID=1585974 RepID=UPI00059A8CDE|nr:ABC transporter ATP-binding protein [Beduini massiliensis]